VLFELLGGVVLPVLHLGLGGGDFIEELAVAMLGAPRRRTRWG
jgi:hypothetical protein